MKHLLAAIFFVATIFITVPASAMQIERVVSPGGIEAWLVEEYEVPVIVMNVAWLGGSAHDPHGKGGLANMVSGLLDEGAGDLDSDAYQKRLQASGAILSYSDDRDYFSAQLKTLAEKRDEAFSLLGMALTRPRFDTDAVERIRAQIASNIARNMQDPGWLASNAWFNAAYGDHPYARPTDGTAQSLAAITRNDLVAYTRNVFARDNMKIAVVGPIKPAELGALLDKTFGGLSAHASISQLSEAKISAKAETVIVKRAYPQSVVIFGGKGLMRADPDFVPAYVMNYMLGGGGFSSRLTDEVREKRGLAYSISTYLYPLRNAAAMLGEVGTKNASVGTSLALVREEFRRVASEGVTDKELADAKTYLTGSYPLRFDSNSKIAGELIGIQQDNLGIDYVDRRNGLINEVTRADILRTAKRLLHEKNLIVAIVGEPDMSAKASRVVVAPKAPEPTHPSESAREDVR